VNMLRRLLGDQLSFQLTDDNLVVRTKHRHP
jgi:hypothetical protein